MMKSKYLYNILLSSVILSCSKEPSDISKTSSKMSRHDLLNNLLVRYGIFSSEPEVTNFFKSRLKNDDLDKFEKILENQKIVNIFEDALKRICEKGEQIDKKKSLDKIIKVLISVNTKDEKEIDKLKNIDDKSFFIKQEKTNNDKKNILKSIFREKIATEMVEYISWLKYNVKDHDDFYNNIENETKKVIISKFTKICETYAKNDADTSNMIQYENIVRDINEGQDLNEKVVNILKKIFNNVTYDFNSFKFTIETTEDKNKNKNGIVLKYLEEAKEHIIEIPIVVKNLEIKDLYRINFDLETIIKNNKDSLDKIIYKNTPDISAKIVRFIEQKFDEVKDNFNTSEDTICKNILLSLCESYKLFKNFIEGKDDKSNKLLGYDFEIIKKNFTVNDSTGEQALYDFVLSKFKEKIERIKSFLNNCNGSSELNKVCHKMIYGVELLDQRGVIASKNNLLEVMNSKLAEEIKQYFPKVGKYADFELTYNNSIFSINIEIPTMFETLTSEGNVLMMNSKKTNILSSLQSKIIKSIINKLQDKKYITDQLITKKQAFINYITNNLENINKDRVINVQNDLQLILSPRGSKIDDATNGLTETIGETIIKEVLKDIFGSSLKNTALFNCINSNKNELSNFTEELIKGLVPPSFDTTIKFNIVPIINNLKGVNDIVKEVIDKYADFISDKDKPDVVWENIIKKYILGDLLKEKKLGVYEKYRLKVSDEEYVPLLIKWMYTNSANYGNTNVSNQQKNFAESVDILLKCFYNPELEYTDNNGKMGKVDFSKFGTIISYKKTEKNKYINMSYVKKQVEENSDIAKKLSTKITWNCDYIDNFNTANAIEIKKIDKFVKELKPIIKKIKKTGGKTWVDFKKGIETNKKIKKNDSWKFFEKFFENLDKKDNNYVQNLFNKIPKPSIDNGSIILNEDIFGLIGDPRGEILCIHPKSAARFCNPIDIEQYNWP